VTAHGETPGKTFYGGNKSNQTIGIMFGISDSLPRNAKALSRISLDIVSAEPSKVFFVVELNHCPQ
jgi:hypothetical protein